jgi:DNA-damage-inducible protein J
MSKSAVVTARIDPELKTRAEYVFEQLGLTTSQAITLFLRQVDLQQGLPLTLKIPNATTQAALKEARLKENLTSYETPDELKTK